MLAQVITENGVKKLKPLTADAGAGAPVGFIAPFYKKGNYSGWLYCDGSTFDETQYPLLYAYLGTNVLPDLREVGLKGAEKNTTYIFDSTETDPRTGQAGTQNHDVFAQGEFKDDQFQKHEHKVLSNQGSAGGAGGGVQASSTPGNFWTQEVNGTGQRSGTVTRGKSFGVFYYIKATSGLTEGQQDDVANIINGERSYSTDEINTGKKWIDGKWIYRKVVDCGNLPNATSKTVNHNISNFGELVTMFARAYSNNTYLPIPYGSTGDPAIIFITKTGVILSTTSNLSSWTGTKVILEYTKTT